MAGNLRTRRTTWKTWKISLYSMIFIIAFHHASSLPSFACDYYYDEHLSLAYNYQNTFTANCRKMSLETLPKHLDPETKHLDISSNKITKLENAGFVNLNLTQLLSLNVSCNEISELGESAFNGLSDLEILILDHNKITQLSADSFEDCSKLRHLGLRGNPIRLPDIKPFLKIRNLETLDLSECNVSRLPANLLQDVKRLQTLKLNRNDLVEISVENLKSLRRLELDTNKINVLRRDTFKFNADIVFLSLSNNIFKVGSKDSVVCSKSLRYLYLNNCGIKELSAAMFANITNIEELYMDWNSISGIGDSFLYLQNLRVLSLRYNKITFLSPDIFKTNAYLNYLDLSGNYLSLANTTLLKLPSLEQLHLSSCNISSLNNAELFAGIENLQRLSLDSNNIEVVSKDVLTNLKSLKYLNMSDNPLKCNRLLRTAWKWCNKKGIVCSAECNNPQGDWNVLRYLEFSDSEYVTVSLDTTSEELSLYLLAMRCFIPFGALAILIGVVFLIRWLINLAILKKYQYNNHYNCESEDSDDESPYSNDTTSGKHLNHDRSHHNQPQG